MYFKNTNNIKSKFYLEHCYETNKNTKSYNTLFYKNGNISSICYYKSGLLHKNILDGPAIISYNENNTEIIKHYYTYGKLISIIKIKLE
jgi:antitoxin component YwqK of YwqJK toxin-antitoxin module